MPTLRHFFHAVTTRAAQVPAWVWSAVLAPFLITRLAYVLVGLYVSPNFQPNPTYQQYAARGWFLSRYFLLDIFARWDGRHYLAIARDGYSFSGALGETMSNIAFFPLYPYLVKALTWLTLGWTGQKTPDSLYLLIGILLSNLFFLAGAYLLYRLATEHLRMNENAARRALVLLFLFPTSFIFSSFYTESLFFFLSLAAFWAAFQRRWMWVGILAGLLALTRPTGVLAAGALFIFYLQQREWKLTRLGLEAAWFSLPALLLAAHLTNMYRLAGNFLAPFVAHGAWGRNRYSILEGLRLQLEAPYLDVFKLDAFFAVLFLAASLYILWKWPHKALGVYPLGMVLVPLATGMLISFQRFMLVVFPVFLLLGEKGKNRFLFELLAGLFFTLQIIYFAGWVNYYWVA